MSDDNTLPQLLDESSALDGAPPCFEELDGLMDQSAAPVSDGMEAVHDVPVKVQAVLGRARMPVGELLRLKAGMVVELDRRVGEPVDIFVNERLIARGEVVMIESSLGVTLTEIVQPEH